MGNQITGKDILDMVVGKLAPQKEEGILPLLRILASQATLPPATMMPTQQATPQLPATPENIGASIANTGKPPRKNYNFLKGK
jgi:hypothetical protein